MSILGQASEDRFRPSPFFSTSLPAPLGVGIKPVSNLIKLPAQSNLRVSISAGFIICAQLRGNLFVRVCHVRSPLKIVIRRINTAKAEAAKMIVVLRNVACILISQCRIIYAARDRILHYLLLLLLRAV